MYCYTIAQNYHCIIRELILWSNTSKEHPTFLLTVAELSGKTLNPEIVTMLTQLHDRFAEIEQAARTLSQSMNTYMGYYQVMRELPALLQRFLQYDQEFIRVLEVILANDGAGVWPVLVHHIKDEQEYMARLFTTLLSQISY